MLAGPRQHGLCFSNTESDDRSVFDLSRHAGRIPLYIYETPRMMTPVLSLSRRLRKSPFESRSHVGAKTASVYNHVVLPTTYASLEEDYWHLREHVQIWDVACQVQVQVQGPDAHKLVKYTRTDLTASETAEFIMPKKPLNLLKGILSTADEEVCIEYNDSNAKFSFGNSVLVCRLIDGKYPNYEAVIPKENPNQLTIARNQFLNSVRRISIFSNKTTHQIRLKIAGAELNISAEDIDYSNKAEERLTCDYQGDDMQIGFNARFLNEMLGNLESDNVQLEMSLPNRAGILTPVDGLDQGEQVTMLVMPVMLNS